MTGDGGGEAAHTDTDAVDSQRSRLLGYLALLAAVVVGYLVVQGVLVLLEIL